MNKEQIIYVDNKPHIKCGVEGYLVRESYNSISKSLQHLYITSDEEIKEGDWYLFNVGYASGIKQADKDDIEQIHLEINPKKIIATTDSLAVSKLIPVDDELHSITNYLPRPSDEFIKFFISEYNKGNTITEVLVEVEDKIALDGHTKIGLELKLDSQNQITIRKQKDSWSRKEVIELLDKLGYDLSPFGGRNEYSKIKSKWIEENL